MKVVNTVVYPRDELNPPVHLLAMFHDAYPALTLEHFIQAPGRDLWLGAALVSGDVYSVCAPDIGLRAAFTWRSAKTRQTVLQRPLPKAARYPAGVVIGLQQIGLAMPGVSAVAVGAELPGPRYDYTLGMAFAALGYYLCGRDYLPEQLTDLVDRVRREYVET